MAAADAQCALGLVLRARQLANDGPAHRGATGKWRIFSWAGSVLRWASTRVWGGDHRTEERGKAHAILLLPGECNSGAALWYDMFCKGATPSALLSAGCTAAALPGVGIGVLEWHDDAGFGARELASIGGDFRDLVGMGFNVGLMFRWRQKFGPHILSEGPFDVTFAVLNEKMGCTLDELVFVHNATSCDLALLKLEWGQALRHGFAFEHVVHLAESHAGIESSLGAPAGAIVAELKPGNVPAGGVALPPTLGRQAGRLYQPILGCKSFKL